MAQDKSSTESKILDAGRELFWKHGFKRVTIDDICENAGVSKMTFYRYFPNKIELAKTIYDKVIKEGYEKFQSILNDNSSPEEKMQKMLMMKKEGTNQISPEFLADFYMNKESELKQFVQERVGQLMKNMIGDFREAQKKGIFRSDFNPEFIFHISYKLSESLDDPQLLKMFGNMQDLIMELSRFFIYGVAPHK
jgi:AcrR family transcriptional regulator